MFFTMKNSLLLKRRSSLRARLQKLSSSSSRRRIKNSSSSKSKKIMLVGQFPNSTKMSIFYRYQYCRLSSKHVSQQPALGINLHNIEIHPPRPGHRPTPINNKQLPNRIPLDVWNLNIEFERYDRLAQIYLENIEAVIGVCSLGNVFSFQKMKYWVEKFYQANSEAENIYLIGLQEQAIEDILQVPKKHLLDYGEQLNAKVFIIRGFTSLTGDLDRFFDCFLQRFIKKSSSSDSSTIKSTLKRMLSICQNNFSSSPRTIPRIRESRRTSKMVSRRTPKRIIIHPNQAMNHYYFAR